MFGANWKAYRPSITLHWKLLVDFSELYCKYGLLFHNQYNIFVGSK